MATSISKTKYVIAATSVPEECVKNAQVLVIGEESWHLIGPQPYKMHCLKNFSPPPVVTCPVVDVRGVTDDEGMGRVIRLTVDPTAGVFNMDGLLTGLEALGGIRVPGAGCQVRGVRCQEGRRSGRSKVRKVRRVRAKARVQ